IFYSRAGKSLKAIHYESRENVEIISTDDGNDMLPQEIKARIINDKFLHPWIFPIKDGYSVMLRLQNQKYVEKTSVFGEIYHDYELSKETPEIHMNLELSRNLDIKSALAYEIREDYPYAILTGNDELTQVCGVTDLGNKMRFTSSLERERNQ
ncbi:MAG: hypothetical protein GOU99_00555, partial [Candidatus Altiarchaeota archaeon]|nr:hypothetical protein [Candidatus Altiarchaeota archaeon]